MKKILLTIFIWQYRVKMAFLAVFLLSSVASAQFIGGGSYSRRGNSQNVRWTLADWLAQKQDFKLMDQWLALNRQTNFFEFNIEGSHTKYELSAGGSVTDQTVDRYSASIFLSIFGLEGGVEKTSEDLKYTYGQFNVRMFGDSSQSTNLVLGYGMRKREDTLNNVEVENQYGNVKLQIYIFDFLGIDGSYRKDFRATDQQNTAYEGERAEYGVFLEYEYIRLYGRAFKDTTYKTANGATTQQETRDGVDAGVKFFF
jgi:hypothetical protein